MNIEMMAREVVEEYERQALSFLRASDEMKKWANEPYFGSDNDHYRKAKRERLEHSARMREVLAIANILGIDKSDFDKAAERVKKQFVYEKEHPVKKYEYLSVFY